MMAGQKQLTLLEELMGELLQPWHLIMLFVIFIIPAILIGMIPFWFICKKAGFSPFLSFLNLVPFGFGTLILVYILAFAEWKVIPAPVQTWIPPVPPPPQA
jgi:hypothetical protein